MVSYSLISISRGTTRSGSMLSRLRVSLTLTRRLAASSEPWMKCHW